MESNHKQPMIMITSHDGQSKFILFLFFTLNNFFIYFLENEHANSVDAQIRAMLPKMQEVSDKIT